jgi:hypothetical protein
MMIARSALSPMSKVMLQRGGRWRRQGEKSPRRRAQKESALRVDIVARFLTCAPGSYSTAGPRFGRKLERYPLRHSRCT